MTIVATLALEDHEDATAALAAAVSVASGVGDVVVTRTRSYGGAGRIPVVVAVVDSDENVQPVGAHGVDVQ